MSYLIALAFLLQVIIGVPLGLYAESAPGKICGAVLFSGSMITLAIGAVLTELEKSRKTSNNATDAMISWLEKLAKNGAGTTAVSGYYVARNGMTEGPHDEATIRALIDSGALRYDTPAMRKGDRDWSTVGDLFPS